jgi:hypothetical protein
VADNIFGMDLLNREESKYGARSKKNLKVKELGGNSYDVPTGLSKAEYQKIANQNSKRSKDTSKRTKARPASSSISRASTSLVELRRVVLGSRCLLVDITTWS